MTRVDAGDRAPRARGQAMVEYAVAIPVFLLILLGMLEFGFAFSHHLTMEYATREGARAGAALANGSAPAVPVADADRRRPGHRGGPARPHRRRLAGRTSAQITEIRIYRPTPTASEPGGTRQRLD